MEQKISYGHTAKARNEDWDVKLMGCKSSFIERFDGLLSTLGPVD